MDRSTSMPGAAEAEGEWRKPWPQQWSRRRRTASGPQPPPPDRPCAGLRPRSAGRSPAGRRGRARCEDAPRCGRRGTSIGQWSWTNRGHDRRNGAVGHVIHAAILLQHTGILVARQVSSFPAGTESKRKNYAVEFATDEVNSMASDETQTDKEEDAKAGQDRSSSPFSHPCFICVPPAPGTFFRLSADLLRCIRESPD